MTGQRSFCRAFVKHFTKRVPQGIQIREEGRRTGRGIGRHIILLDQSNARINQVVNQFSRVRGKRFIKSVFDLFGRVIASELVFEHQHHRIQHHQSDPPNVFGKRGFIVVFVFVSPNDPILVQFGTTQTAATVVGIDVINQHNVRTIRVNDDVFQFEVIEDHPSALEELDGLHQTAEGALHRGERRVWDGRVRGACFAVELSSKGFEIHFEVDTRNFLH